MREIKFRGIGADGIMYYGRLSQDRENSTRYYNEYSQRICWNVGAAQHNIPVSNKTLGQYITLKDKNGVEIYDGDKVSFVKTYNNKRYIGEVKYIPEVAGYMLCAMNKESWHSFEFGLGTIELEVVGNIHEQESHT